MESIYSRPLYKVVTIINNCMKDILNDHSLILHEVSTDKKFGCYKELKVELHSINNITGNDKVILMAQMYDRVLKESLDEDIKRLTNMVESKVLEQLLTHLKDGFKNVQL